MGEHFISTPVSIFRIRGGRKCQISTTAGPCGDGVVVETFDRDGIKLCGTLTLDTSDVPGLLAGVVEVARSLGFGITGEISMIGGAALASDVGHPRAL